MTAMSFFSIIYGSNWIFIVIAEDITNDVTAFNDSTAKVPKDSDRAELMEHFCNIVQCYLDAKQWVIANFIPIF